MTLTRRTFLSGALAAPVVITTPGLLMPVKPVLVGPALDWSARYPAWWHHMRFAHFKFEAIKKPSRYILDFEED